MLVTMKAILDRASKENYGVAAPNVGNEWDIRAAIEVAEELNAPLILDIGWGANNDMFFAGELARKLAKQSKVPVCINLDHGGSLEQIVSCIHAGFTSVMIDRSACDFDKNVEDTKEVVKIAHAAGVTVEAEFGHVGQGENAEHDTTHALTDPAEAKKFVDATGVDCLAVAIGTAHGAYPKGFVPHLDLERLQAIKAAVGQDFPLVLHGSSGMDNDSLQKACSMGINKINISNDLCRAMCTAAQEADFTGNASYGFMDVAKNAFKAKLAEKIKVYGSAGKAWTAECAGLPITPEEGDK